MFALLHSTLANYHSKSTFAVNATLDSSVAGMMDGSLLAQTLTISTICVAVTCNLVNLSSLRIHLKLLLHEHFIEFSLVVAVRANIFPVYFLLKKVGC